MVKLALDWAEELRYFLSAMENDTAIEDYTTIFDNIATDESRGKPTTIADLKSIVVDIINRISSGDITNIDNDISELARIAATFRDPRVFNKLHQQVLNKELDEIERLAIEAGNPGHELSQMEENFYIIDARFRKLLEDASKSRIWLITSKTKIAIAKLILKILQIKYNRKKIDLLVYAEYTNQIIEIIKSDLNEAINSGTQKQKELAKLILYNLDHRILLNEEINRGRVSIFNFNDQGELSFFIEMYLALQGADEQIAKAIKDYYLYLGFEEEKRKFDDYREERIEYWRGQVGKNFPDVINDDEVVIIRSRNRVEKKKVNDFFNEFFYGRGGLKTIQAIIMGNGIEEIPPSMRLQEGFSGEMILSNKLKAIPSEFLAYSQITELILPPTVKELGNLALFRCESLKRLELGFLLEKFGEEAIAYTGIEELHLPPYVWYFGWYACKGCKIKSIEFPSSTKIIGKGAFSDCSDLSKVLFNDGIQKIELEAFDCTNVKEASVPANAELDEDAFGEDCIVTRTGKERKSLEIQKVTPIKVTRGDIARAVARELADGKNVDEERKHYARQRKN